MSLLSAFNRMRNQSAGIAGDEAGIDAARMELAAAADWWSRCTPFDPQSCPDGRGFSYFNRL